MGENAPWATGFLQGHFTCTISLWQCSTEPGTTARCLLAIPQLCFTHRQWDRGKAPCLVGRHWGLRALPGSGMQPPPQLARGAEATWSGLQPEPTDKPARSRYARVTCQEQTINPRSKLKVLPFFASLTPCFWSYLLSQEEKQRNGN